MLKCSIPRYNINHFRSSESATTNLTSTGALYMSFGDVLALAGAGVPGLDAAVTTGKFHSPS